MFPVTAVLLISILGLVNCQIPVPSRPQGFPYGASSCLGLVHVEAYMDLICPNSKNVFPVLLQVADYYGITNLSLNMLMFPLPYHRAAFLAGQGTFVVDSLSEGTATYKWMKIMFDYQEQFYDANILQTTQDGLIDSLAKYAALSGIDKAAFKKRLTLNDASAYDTVIQWKYGCSRTVSGTPFISINGVFVEASSWTFEDWKKAIDPLIN